MARCERSVELVESTRRAESVTTRSPGGRRARPLLVAVLVAAAPAAAAAAPGSWRLLPPAPIDLAGVSAGTWTGSEVLLTVPTTPVRRSAAFNPATGTWRRLPGGPAPSVPLEGRDRGAWTGTEWLLVGWGPSSAYRPSSNTWRRLPAGSGPPAGPTAVWSGSEFLAWGGGCCAEFQGTGAAYRPATNRWRTLPAAPLAGRQGAAAVWTGTEMIVLGGFTERLFPDGVTRSVVFNNAAAYNPRTNRWRRLPPMPAPRRHAIAVWTGRDLLVVGGRRGNLSGRLPAGVFAYRPATNRWRLLRPMPRGRVDAAGVWTGSRLLVWGGVVDAAAGEQPVATTLAFNPASNTWTRLASAPIAGRSGATAVWTGREMVIAGGFGASPDATVAAFDP